MSHAAVTCTPYVRVVDLPKREAPDTVKSRIRLVIVVAMRGGRQIYGALKVMV